MASALVSESREGTEILLHRRLLPAGSFLSLRTVVAFEAGRAEGWANSSFPRQ